MTVRVLLRKQVQFAVRGPEALIDIGSYDVLSIRPGKGDDIELWGRTFHVNGRLIHADGTYSLIVTENEYSFVIQQGAKSGDSIVVEDDE